MNGGLSSQISIGGDNICFTILQLLTVFTLHDVFQSLSNHIDRWKQLSTTAQTDGSRSASMLAQCKVSTYSAMRNLPSSHIECLSRLIDLNKGTQMVCFRMFEKFGRCRAPRRRGSRVQSNVSHLERNSIQKRIYEEKMILQR